MALPMINQQTDERTRNDTQVGSDYASASNDSAEISSSIGEPKESTTDLPSWVNAGPNVTETSRKTSIKLGLTEAKESLSNLWVSIKSLFEDRPESPKDGEYGWTPSGSSPIQPETVNEGGLQRKQQFEVAGQAAIQARQQQIQQLGGRRRSRQPLSLRLKELRSKLSASKEDLAAARLEAGKPIEQHKPLVGIDGWLMLFVIVFGIAGFSSVIMFLLSLSSAVWPFSVLSLVNYLLAPALAIVSTMTIVFAVKHEKRAKTIARICLVLLAVYIDLTVVVLMDWDLYINGVPFGTFSVGILP